ncbi:hypothetical protein K458DRAFT_113041 [Lentithecium fluviatile CBS 122367]|uniref:Uncharacterized protein n=1 Tax=Lentithecium fluviatile CBS 122367 TaxID=1168545 RepID=A0A6G1INX6_9PLEO|nr:hypothetical protein K458DRAFT_113041 [Lentithecium fluviatile CBS 122367]
MPHLADKKLGIGSAVFLSVIALSPASYVGEVVRWPAANIHVSPGQVHYRSTRKHPLHSFNISYHLIPYVLWRAA